MNDIAYVLPRASAWADAAGGSADRLADVRQLDRATWRMPPLDQLPKPVMSPLRTAGCCCCAAT
jgi:hypothetical protein